MVPQAKCRVGLGLRQRNRKAMSSQSKVSRKSLGGNVSRRRLGKKKKHMNKNKKIEEIEMYVYLLWLQDCFS